LPTHGPDLSRLSVSQLATVTGFDRRTVRQRLAGLEPVEQTGRELRYESRAALAQLYVGDTLELNRERARLAAAQAERVEMQNGVERGELVPAADVERFTVGLLSACIQRLDALPAKIAPDAHAAPSIAGCEDVIRRAIHEARQELADALGNPGHRPARANGATEPAA
jgi:phage terminase Nu1 subunit (DNA packaging protein)